MTAIGQLRRESYDWGNSNTDTLGISYICIALIHTLLVIILLSILYSYKNSSSIRLRCFYHIAFTVILLQIFADFVLLAYPLKGLYKCGTEFWIMSTILPFSMALFQASNIRLLSCYQEQLRLVRNCYLDHKSCRKDLRDRSLRGCWKRLNCAERTYIGVGIGIFIQLVITFTVYFGSRRFHSSYGFFSEYVDASRCRRGIEWVPSIFWQLVWSTIAGPYILLRIRHIRDNHLWAWQTRLAIISCLPGTPLWLVFTFVQHPKIETINKYFIPPGWFLPGIIAMQLLSVFFPILDAKRHQAPTAVEVADFPIIIPDTNMEPVDPHQLSPRDLYSMASLEMQISKNLDPLLRWAAEKEFTAENIIFLRVVRDFKRKWAMAHKRSGYLSSDAQRERYEDAALIWFKLVNPSTAKFNINIDYRTLKELEQLFEGLHYEPYESDDASMKSDDSRKTENLVAPWEDQDHRERDMPLSWFPIKTGRIGGSDAVDRLYKIPITEISTGGINPVPPLKMMPSAESTGSNSTRNTDFSFVYCDSTAATSEFDYTGTYYADFVIPAAFNNDIFDKAFESVKNDVFRNTWVRYEAASLANGGQSTVRRFMPSPHRSKTESVLMSVGPEAKEDTLMNVRVSKRQMMWRKIKEFGRRI